MLRIHQGSGHILHTIEATRAIEVLAANALPANTLMQRAGLAVAKLVLATAPHAERIWLACGPGNNGGDGLEAAKHLARWGKQPIVTWFGTPEQASSDTLAAYKNAAAAGVRIQPFAHSQLPKSPDLCVDALLGIGTNRNEPQGDLAHCIAHMGLCNAPIVAVDIPTGLNADTGSTLRLHVKATHTLSMLTLKPGLFTTMGRDASGHIWWDDLGVDTQSQTDSACAQLTTSPTHSQREHASHKGTYGDVAIIGGAMGMTGAALLAAKSALHFGAGRVLVGLLSNQLHVDIAQPELMFRSIDVLELSQLTVVSGCGGGEAIKPLLPKLITSSMRLVMDADALNAVASDPGLKNLITERGRLGKSTVITPHPLEAARLLDCTATQIQNNRLEAAQQLSRALACTVVLKGSGTVIASPACVTRVNTSGNGRLATAGTGDVLAGMVGAKLAAGMTAHQAACDAVYLHGQMADTWPHNTPLTASQLAAGSHP